MVENPASGVEGAFLPMHMLCLRDMGLMLGEYWDLTALAADQHVAYVATGTNAELRNVRGSSQMKPTELTVSGLRAASPIRVKRSIVVMPRSVPTASRRVGLQLVNER